MELQNCIYQVDGPIVTVSINRPEVRNALDTQTWRELQQAFDAANGDDSVRVIVLTGAGEKVFASGADLGFVNQRTPAEYREYLETNARTRVKIRNLDKPVICRMNGHATGGAMGLALSCDLIVAAEHVRMGQTEINVGLIGGVMHLWTAGKARTAEIMLTGRHLTAAEALEMGLVNRVVPVQQLDQAVKELADSIIAKSPYATRLTKRSLALALDAAGYDVAVASQMDLVCIAFASEDRKEGISAFLEKRKPNFTGN